ncbi:hypothetical protein EV182_000842 [Spiromyces aspiralis]|uniref:Uncharacterized protein n=1 Tax=Spiromyces aspiralis TaxID=68401 RepID=A0ACC1HJZ6_9FUNG|nr:hypothetical protein EV182_000842 [Spiromyces aspiralis]
MATKGWYWQLEPAKSALARYSSLKDPPPCPKCCLAAGFAKDSNGTGRNTNGCFRCKACKLKLRAKDFWSEVLKLPLDALPPRELPQDAGKLDTL